MSNHAHHTGTSGSKRKLKLAAWVTGAYFVFEMGVGLYTGSVMVIVDAFHTFSAVGGVVLALLAQKIARRPRPTDRRSAVNAPRLSAPYSYNAARDTLISGRG